MPTERERSAHAAIAAAGHKLPPIEQCSFLWVLDCVMCVRWPGYEAMYAPATGKVVKPYKV